MARTRGVAWKEREIAVIAGLRTPFLKQGSRYAHLSALELGTLVVNELVQRSRVDPSAIEQLVYGQVVPSVAAPNIAREIVLGTSLPQDIDAYSVSRACATSFQSVANIAEAITTGQIDVGIAGGADSASDVPVTISTKLRDALFAVSKAKSFPAQLRPFAKLAPKDLVPVPPAIKERVTGLSMGEAAEKMAKENSIARKDQDAFAHRSHTRAAAAWSEGKLRDEVMELFLPPKYKETIEKDGLIRFDSELDAYAKLKPAFDRKHGTITAGSSSPLTDGASAVILMRGEKAKALGISPLGTIRSYAFVALDPRGQLLMGPAYATPVALAAAGVKFSDIDLIDMHEAFSAQVLSNTQAFESKAWAQEKLGLSERIGEVPWDRFNVLGGSIAYGHPFAATGTRQLTQTLRELKRRGGGLGLCTACAAGGLGVAMVVEVS